MANEPTEQPPPLLNVADVAQWLNVSPSLVYQLVESRKLSVYRIGKGRGAIRFRPADVEAYLETCRSEEFRQTQPRKQRPRLKHIRID